ncbi:hypothetical protein [Mangrovimonas spongiae]|uniref:Uncharacterized protein n=1 Tax=Mangrovimonas spongiae TaxID=2494697 RepID=A0A3R9MFA5_9FLAO|nr:hypothetical protein [Mangrovimonas spongiae]RSK40743.1 hypothetical protein EJA19_07120 [Mangrovimonas spongiae]
MNSGITLIEAVLIAICASPFILMAINKAKNNKKHLLELSTLAKQNNYQITQHEVFANISLGLDTIKNQLLFVRNDNNIITQESINLSEIKHCTVLKHNDSKNQKNVSEINLVLTPKETKHPEKKLTFFNIQTEMMLSGQLQVAEKWKDIIDIQSKK